jgi:nitrogen fixation protein
MADLDQVLTSVTDEDTLIDSVIALLNGVEQQLKDALAGVTLPPGVQAKIDAVFDKVEASKAKVNAAIVANTPAAP